MKTFFSINDTHADGCAGLFKHTYGLERVEDPADADVLIWNGGADIGTLIYGDQPVKHGGPLNLSSRDHAEITLFDSYKSLPGKLLLGVCRGSQLLNCLNGGKLYQDVDGHYRAHPMVDLRTGEVLIVTSTHHQQMIPAEHGEVIGVADQSRFKNSYRDGEEKFLPAGFIKQGRDVEIMWYPDTHSLCVQGHPEYVPQSRFAAYTWELLQQCWQAIQAQTKAA